MKLIDIVTSLNVTMQTKMTGKCMWLHNKGLKLRERFDDSKMLFWIWKNIVELEQG